MSTTIPSPTRHKMNPSMIALMKRSDSVHADALIVPERDYITYDHVYNRRENFGDILRLMGHTNGEMRFECATEFMLRNRDMKVTNEARIHFITEYAQSADTTINELSYVLNCYTKDPNILLVYAKSIIRPIKDLRFNQLLNAGEIIDNGVNLIVEQVNTKFKFNY